MTPADLFAARVRANPADPLLTFYDDATGERVELSATTTANWVAKTSNLLQDGFGVETGQRVGVLLPLHWQTAVVLLACWSVGAEVILDAVDADVLVAAEGKELDEARAAGVRDVIGLSLRAMGRPLASAVAGVTDFAREVLGYPDDFAAAAPVDDGATALRIGAAEWTGRALAADATEAAARSGKHARVLTVRAYDDEPGIRLGLLAPIAAGGSLVLCRNLDEDRLAKLVRTEQVTATVGVGVESIQRLDG